MQISESVTGRTAAVSRLRHLPSLLIDPRASKETQNQMRHNTSRLP